MLKSYILYPMKQPAAMNPGKRLIPSYRGIAKSHIMEQHGYGSLSLESVIEFKGQIVSNGDCYEVKLL